MRALLCVLLFLVVLAATGIADPEGLPIQYMDRRGRMPMSTDLRMQLMGDRGPYSRTVVASLSGGGTDADKVVLLVEEDISSGISSSLATFQSDLENEGYEVEVWLISGGSAEDIRSDLQAEYSSSSLVGAICIGDIPTGWMDSGFGEYPVDVFLMDMNGNWSDPDSDGLYESASGESPEIWVGRLTPTYLTYGGPEDLLNDYFAKNHAYRTGTLTLPDRALAYEEAFVGLTDYVDNLYPTVVTRNNPSTTNADDFKAELLNGYEWVHLISHSSPWGSSFHDGAPPGGGGTVNNFEIIPLDPNAFFYVLNCCSNGRWTEIDNMANTYIWSDSYGLAVLAQTKVDYTNDFQEYYMSLASGNCLGDAFRVWLAANMGYEHAAVLLGDPTLMPRLSSIGLGSQQGGGVHPNTDDNWPSWELTAGLHTQGRVDTYSDPSSGEVFAVSGTSDPVRANILAIHSDGDTWAAPMTVCEHTYWDWHPTVGGDGTGNVWTAWQSMDNNHEGYDIYVSQWTGSTWASETILTNGDPYEVEPSLSGGNGYAWLVWQKWQNASTDIEGVFWTGSGWSSIQEITNEDGGERYPDVAYGGSGFGLVYHARRNGNWVICFRDAADSGPFGSETIISTAGVNSRYPCITSDGTDYWVVWQDDSGTILSSHQSGSSWTAPEVISPSTGCSMPSIAASPDGEEITAVWTIWDYTIQTNTFVGSAWEGYFNAVSSDAIADGSVAWADGKLWVVYGKRDVDLQWDLWACTTDPQGSEGPEISPGVLGIAITGSNPFTSSIALQVTASGDASLRIYDLTGRVVLQERVEPGPYSWNGISSTGTAVPPGIYFAVVSDNTGTESCRLIRL